MGDPPDDLIVTPGAADAESYVTVAEADTMAANAGLTGWTGKSDDEKKAALRRAAIEIDSHRFHDQVPWADGQARAFPRAKDLGVIPAAVQWTQVFQADFLAASAGYDASKWEGAKGAPMKDAGMGSPLCPLAFRTLARLISRAGGYSPLTFPEPA